MIENKELRELALKQQENEITEHHIYQRLAKRAKSEHNRSVLEHIAEDEMRHYNILKKYTEVDRKPRMREVMRYIVMAKVFGLTFTLKLMESGEGEAQAMYERLRETVPETEEIIRDEGRHERELLNQLKENKLDYVGSIVLGLNDALVELTGALAGFTFALQNPQLIAVAGLITGIAASFSMGASEYLSTKAENDSRNPVLASLYTGGAYAIVVALLIAPYLLIENPYLSLGIMLGIAVVIIFVFNFYVSVAQDVPFKKRFWEMTLLSLGVAFVSFVVGLIVRSVFGIEV